MSYAYRGAPPVTLTDAEQRAVLRETGELAERFRDHLIIAMALGCGLREHELAALDVMDVVPTQPEVAELGRVPIRKRIRLRVFKGHRRANRRHVEWVILPEELRRKLARYIRRLETPLGSLELTAPLFTSRKGCGRLSLRQIRHLWAEAQRRAKFERHLSFHCLRHTYISNVYRARKDPHLAMRLARHRRLDTTQIYLHATDEELERVARDLPC